jgi:uncharacterized coiled-coil protein SlyX
MEREDIERIRGLEEKITSQEKALELQAREYERRLDHLNFAHERHEKFVNTFPSKIELDANIDKINMRLDILIGRISTLEGAERGKHIAGSSIYALLAVFISVLALASRFF